MSLLGCQDGVDSSIMGHKKANELVRTITKNDKTITSKEFISAYKKDIDDLDGLHEMLREMGLSGRRDRNLILDSMEKKFAST